jgi:hypothetical protein
VETSLGGRRCLAAPVAVALSMLLAAQATAAAWSPPKALTSSGDAWGTGLVTLGTSTAVAAFEDGGRIFVRRSTDGGMNWASRLRLTTSGYESDIAGRGSNVDVVWVQNDRVRYARSTNGGASFGSSVALSPTSQWAAYPRVARGPNGRVVVAWHDFLAGAIRVRVSKNGGSSFAAAKKLASTPQAWEPLRPAVAVGKGVIYVAYFLDETRLRVRRSVDSGATWSAATKIADNATVYGWAELTASGSQAYVAYTAENATAIWVRARRTANKGSSWASATNLSPSTDNTSIYPVISLAGGVARAAFTRCLDVECMTAGVFYRQSSDGTSWSAVEPVPTGTAPVALADGIGYAGRIVVLFTTWDEDVRDVHVTTGSP